MDRWIRSYLVIVGLMVHVTPLWAAEVFRVGFPSLATGFAPSWVTADKGIWKKNGLDVELIYLRGGSRTVSALIGGSVDFILGLGSWCHDGDSPRRKPDARRCHHQYTWILDGDPAEYQDGP